MGGLLVYEGLALTRGGLADGPVGDTHDLAVFDYDVVILYLLVREEGLDLTGHESRAPDTCPADWAAYSRGSTHE
jgi:hypothetical protein